MRPFYVLAGPPGAGKTTTLKMLGNTVTTVAEPARRVLVKQRASGGTGTGDQDRRLFVTLMLKMACADYQAASGLTLFDRGLPDLLAFCAHYELSAAPVHRAVSAHRYASKVFWFPAWAEIYATDDERILDFAGAQAFGDLIQVAYTASEYTLVPVPFDTPQARAAFILAQIER